MPRRPNEPEYRQTPFLPSQRNHVFELIQGRGFEASEFRWTRRKSAFGSYVVDALIHIPSHYYFIFDVNKSEIYWWARFSPGQRQLEEGARIQFPPGLEDYFGYIGSIWLPQLRNELAQPDLWAGIGQAANLLPLTARESEVNATFSPDERAFIARQLEFIEKQLIGLYAETEEQANVIREALEDVKDASTRLGRKDWILLVTGQLFSLATTMAMDGSKARALFELVRQALSELPKLV